MAATILSTLTALVSRLRWRLILGRSPLLDAAGVPTGLSAAEVRSGRRPLSFLRSPMERRLFRLRLFKGRE